MTIETGTTEATGTTPAAPASVGGSTETVSTAPTGGAADHGAEKPTWAPSFKFKVYDKEHEIPENFRSFIKDQDSEKQFRELFEKSYALDEHKQIHQKVLGSLDEYKGKTSEYETTVQRTQDGLKRLYGLAHNDFGSFLEAYKIPPDAVINYVKGYLAEQEMPENERREKEELRQRARAAFSYESQLEELRRENQGMVMSQHNATMNMALGQPEVRDFVGRFDSTYGQGQFSQHVIDYGNRVYAAQKRYISPFDAVKAVMDYYGRGINQSTPQMTPQLGQSGQPQQPMPQVGRGSQLTPAKRKFKNLDEMRKFVAENYAE